MAVPIQWIPWDEPTQCFCCHREVDGGYDFHGTFLACCPDGPCRERLDDRFTIPAIPLDAVPEDFA